MSELSQANLTPTVSSPAHLPQGWHLPGDLPHPHLERSFLRFKVQRCNLPLPYFLIGLLNQRFLLDSLPPLPFPTAQL